MAVPCVFFVCLFFNENEIGKEGHCLILIVEIFKLLWKIWTEG